MRWYDTFDYAKLFAKRHGFVLEKSNYRANGVRYRYELYDNVNFVGSFERNLADAMRTMKDARPLIFGKNS